MKIRDIAKPIMSVIFCLLLTSCSVNLEIRTDSIMDREFFDYSAIECEHRYSYYHTVSVSPAATGWFRIPRHHYYYCDYSTAGFCNSVGIEAHSISGRELRNDMKLMYNGRYYHFVVQKCDTCKTSSAGGYYFPCTDNNKDCDRTCEACIDFLAEYDLTGK